MMAVDTRDTHFLSHILYPSLDLPNKESISYIGFANHVHRTFPPFSRSPFTGSSIAL